MHTGTYKVNVVDPASIKIGYSLFTGLYDNRPVATQGTPVQMVGNTHRVVESKAEAGLYSLGVFKPGSTRSKENVLEVHALVLDLDDVDAFLYMKAENILKRFASVTHSTFRHGIQDDYFRVRIVLLLSRSVSAREYQAIVDVIRGDFSRFGIEVDPASKHPEHLFYQASVHPSRTNKSFFRVNCGVQVNVDWALARASVGCERKGSNRDTSYVGSERSLRDICKSCHVYGNLFLQLEQGLDLNNRERVRVGQLLRALDVPLEDAIHYFAKTSNFKRSITESNLRSFKGFPPSCQSLAGDLGMCDGNCPSKQTLQRQSPLFFARDLKIKNKLEK